MKKIAWWLVIIGALNWGLVGVFNFNLVSAIFDGGGPMSIISRIIYILVGASAVYVFLGKCGCNKCFGGRCDVKKNNQ